MGGRHRDAPVRTYFRWIVTVGTASALAATTTNALLFNIPPPTPLPAIETPVNQSTEIPQSPPLSPTPSPPSPTTTPPLPTTTLPPEPELTTTPPPPPTTTKPDLIPDKLTANTCSTRLAGTLPFVAEAGRHIMEKFGLLESLIGGRGGRTNVSDHPSGHALDFMVNRVTGDKLADYVLANADLLSVKYVIWRQRIKFPGGSWKIMEDRGGATANHYDHVHVSFLQSPTGDPTC